MSAEKGPKEKAWDEYIRPRLDEIQALCEVYQINFATYFALDEIIPKCVLQGRQAQVNDQTDLVGASTVFKIWDAIQDNEEEFQEQFAPHSDREEN